MKELAEFLRTPDLVGHLGNAVYITTFLLAALCLARGHRQDKINLWDLVNTTSRSGKVYTDPRKLFEVGAFLVTTVSFFYLTVTGKMNAEYALIYVGAWVAARTLRDKAKIQQQSISKQAEGDKT